MPAHRILAILAHPDDVDFGAAGSVAKWTDSGDEVIYVVLTDGDSGGFDLDVPRRDIPGIRRAEQQAAAEAVGVKDVRFLGYPDGSLSMTTALRRDLARVIRQVRPGRVVCHTPERNWDSVYASHPDHLAAGEATMAAVYPDARNPFAHPELLLDERLEPHVVPEVWLVGSPQPNRYVDITEFYDRKLAAVRCHASQMEDPAGGAPASLERWLRDNAVRGGLGDDRLAEAFQVVDTR